MRRPHPAILSETAATSTHSRTQNSPDQYLIKINTRLPQGINQPFCGFYRLYSVSARWVRAFRWSEGTPCVGEVGGLSSSLSMSNVFFPSLGVIFTFCSCTWSEDRLSLANTLAWIFLYRPHFASESDLRLASGPQVILLFLPSFAFSSVLHESITIPKAYFVTMADRGRHPPSLDAQFPAIDSASKNAVHPQPC